ncbi:hypothetical protein BJF78_28445 [Pseudonocardia sp. CNS-139]|nr:hypothetical protein BJF78_28445 [Pseudonocardia sp. CNS-139]
MQGVLDVGAELRACGCPVSDFVADVRDGVVYSSVTCTVSLAETERDAFEQRMTAVPAVISVAPC